MDKLSPPARAVAGLALAALVAQLLAGCSGGTQSLPSTGAVSNQPSVAAAHSEEPSKAWISPNAKAAAQLLYVANTFSSVVAVYELPNLKQVGELTGFEEPAGMCTDKRGDVYVTDFFGRTITEYAHGGLVPIQQLTDSYGYVQSCAVSPKTGDLAVTTFGTPSGPGNVLVFKHARGTPAVYKPANLVNESYPAYDPKGNLFVNGYANSGTGLAELPYGATTFETISLNESVVSPAGLQWDGQHLAIGDSSDGAVLQLTISGSTGEVVGSTALTGGAGLAQFDVSGSQIFGAIASGGSVDIWNYPAGGTPTNSISYLNEPEGVVISAK